MAEEQKIQKVSEIQRIYEYPPEAISFYCDLGQILRTENEIVIQFYETIPGFPDLGGNIKNVRTRLRASITVSLPHARNIGKLLIEKSKGGVKK
jgi:hypothetical protein